MSAKIQNNPGGEVRPFKIAISPAEVEDLNRRIDQTRWPDSVRAAGWNYGADIDYMRAIAHYWRNEFDWAAQEKRLNAAGNYLVEIDGMTIHFVHQRGKSKNPIPLVLLHGWPGSFVQMLNIIPLLTAGGVNQDSFDVIVPSLPGYGFSGKPEEQGMSVYKMAQFLQRLMVEKLGYNQFLVRATDMGAGVAREWALSYPDHVLALHLSGSNPYVYQPPSDLTEAEKAFIARGQQFLQAEGGYAALQSTKPQTLAFGLNDSPLGLASWILEKFKGWTDNPGDPAAVIPKDELLTNISLYWFTGTIGSSMRSYYESAHHWSPNGNGPVQQPTAFLMFGHDIAVAPREWEERSYHIVRWNQQEAGGHFPEWEQPEVVARDIREFCRSLNINTY